MLTIPMPREVSPAGGAAAIPLWTAAHLRFWTVATLTRLAPPVALVGSPLYNLCLRALGARIEPGAVILSRTVPVCTDLLTVGPDAVIGKNGLFVMKLGSSRRHALSRVR